MILGERQARKIDEIVSRYVSDNTPGLSLLVGHKGKILLKKGYGLADVEKGIPLDPDKAFFIASISKQFTTMAIMMLKERGLLNYDEPIGKYFHDFPPYKDKVTIRHLMTHTSGIPDYFGDKFIEKAHELQDRLTQDVLLEDIKKYDLEFEPDTKFSYSNSGYVMLGAIVEKVSGMSFADFLMENIFKPLGMKRTAVGVSPQRLISNIAMGYDEPEKGHFVRMPIDMATIGWADGNVLSTVEDLFIWHNALYTESLVKYETLREAFTAHTLKDGKSTGYGFGWFIDCRRGLKEIWHSGGTVGYISRFSRFVDEDVAVIMLTNNQSWAGIKRDEIFGQIVDCVLEDKMEPLKFIKLTGDELKDYEGYYFEKGSVCECDYDNESEDLKIRCDTPRLKGEYKLNAIAADHFRFDSPADYYVTFLRQDDIIAGIELKISGMKFRLRKK